MLFNQASNSSKVCIEVFVVFGDTFSKTNALIALVKYLQ